MTALITVPNLGPEFDVGVILANKVTLLSATDIVAGKVELATVAETTAGVDAVRAVTPAGLAAVISAQNNAIQFQEEGVALGSSGTVTTVNFVGPDITAARAGNAVTVTVAAAGGGPTGAAGGGLTGTYPNPGLSGPAITAFATVVHTDAFGVALGRMFP